MFKQAVLTAAGVAAAALMVAGTAQANPITTLYNTGVDASGTPLADGVIGDSHYALVSLPGGTSDIRIRTSAGGYPIPPYFGDDAFSTWIGPNNDAQVDGPVGLYDYRTTFDLTGFNASTASITGLWSSDNDGVQILLNGVSIAGPTNFAQFSLGFANFSASSGFNSGLNTLDFIVNNGGGPTAVRVEMTGSADAKGGAVPEPATWAMMIGGFGLAGAALRRRRTAVAA